MERNSSGADTKGRNAAVSVPRVGSSKWLGRRLLSDTPSRSPCGSNTTKTTSRNRCSAMAAAIPGSTLSGFDTSPNSAFTVARKESASSVALASARLTTFWRSTKKVVAASTTSTTVIAAVYHSVRRIRTELNIVAVPRRGRFVLGGSPVRRKHVARSASRVQQRFHRSNINFAPHPVDIHLDQIRERIELLVPHVLRDLRPSHH